MNQDYYSYYVIIILLLLLLLLLLSLPLFRRYHPSPKFVQINQAQVEENSFCKLLPIVLCKELSLVPLLMTQSMALLCVILSPELDVTSCDCTKTSYV
jgi:hypothetical protein